MPPELQPDENEDDLKPTAAEDGGEGGDVNPDGEDAGSSAADEQADMLSVVQAALEQREDSPTSEDGRETEGGPKATAEAATEDAPEELTDEESQSLKPKTRRYIERLTGERNAARDEVTQFKSGAEAFGRITTFMHENNISKDAVGIGFDAMAAFSKGDYDTAWKLLAPTFQTIAQARGDLLPTDLQEAVRAGEMTADHAKETARLRASKRTADDTGRRQQETQQRQRHAEAWQGQVKAVTDRLSEWESRRRAKDPDWQAKQSKLLKEIELRVLRAGKYPTPEETEELAEAALKSVEDELRKFAPSRKEMRPVTGAATANAASPKPQSTLDVVRQTLGAA